VNYFSVLLIDELWKAEAIKLACIYSVEFFDYRLDWWRAYALKSETKSYRYQIKSELKDISKFFGSNNMQHRIWPKMISRWVKTHLYLETVTTQQGVNSFIARKVDEWQDKGIKGGALIKWEDNSSNSSVNRGKFTMTRGILSKIFFF